MKTLILLLTLFSQLAGASECFTAEIERGSIDPHRRENLLVMQYAGNSGGRGYIGVMSKDGSYQASGDTLCSGGAPDSCRFGQDGQKGYFQFIQNRPTIVLNGGRLKVESGDGDEEDLRAVASLNSFHYVMDSAEQAVCARIFPQEVEPKRPGRRSLPMQPSISVPVAR
jgi:hypothetical protein